MRPSKCTNAHLKVHQQPPNCEAADKLASLMKLVVTARNGNPAPNCQGRQNWQRYQDDIKDQGGPTVGNKTRYHLNKPKKMPKWQKLAWE